jgi:predicted GTPase
LYHGNLSVRENEDAAKWLIENVFSELDLHCIVSGLNPSDKLKKLADNYSNVTLVANPDDAEMIDLLRQAQVNILVTNQPTGLKLKLLNALYNGRFCLVNSDMVKGTSLESLCVMADEPEQMITEIKRLMDEDFTEEDIEERDAQMRQLYDNEANARKIVEAISFKP